jgi:hypothetical protein
MAGHVFPALRSCYIRFPHHINTIGLQPVSMPSCTDFGYYSHDIGALRYFHRPPLHSLTVESGQWSVWRGNSQLISLGHTVIASSQSLTKLGVHVQCSESLLTEMLKLVPALKYLELGLTSPHALSEKFFQKFVATEPSPSSLCEKIWLPRLWCLDLSYKRWLRGPERKTLIPVFGDIVKSRQERKITIWLVCPDDCMWEVLGRVERFCEHQSYDDDVIGISSQHGIALISPFGQNLGPHIVPFKEAEYLYVNNGELSIDILFTLHHLVELRTSKSTHFIEPTALPVNLPFYHVIRVLEAAAIHSSYLAGQTFTKLERCRVRLDATSPSLSDCLFTEMPVCTRLDVRDLSLLATFKIPLVCELGVAFGNPESNLIWDRGIAVNTNLSRLRLLHVHYWDDEVDLIQVLRSVPVLVTLILGNGDDLNVDFFKAFIPNQTSGPRQSNSGTQTPTVLCPMLESLWVEGIDPTEQSELMRVLREVAMSRAVVGSPLKGFTFVVFWPQPGRKLELVGWDGSFTKEKTFLHKNAKPFKLEI